MGPLARVLRAYGEWRGDTLGGAMGKVRVRLFARLADVVGARAVEVEIGEGLTAGDVFAVLAREHPGIAGMTVAFAVNAEYAEAGQPLREGDEVALIPPVSGGAARGAVHSDRSDLPAPLRSGRDDKPLGFSDVL